MMGCSPGDNDCSADEKPARQVEITEGFWIGETPVTQEAYERVMGSNPSLRKEPRLPVYEVIWEEAVAFCQAVDMRLPTEAEWEYAARAGNIMARYGGLAEIAWYSENAREQTAESNAWPPGFLVASASVHEVKGKKPNAWGLYDTLGNVDEWVEGWCDSFVSEGLKDRVVRGGSWTPSPRFVRVSSRCGVNYLMRELYIGFRCAGQLS
jgi:sulfatase modifying factor 1